MNVATRRSLLAQHGAASAGKLRRPVRLHFSPATSPALYARAIETGVLMTGRSNFDSASDPYPLSTEISPSASVSVFSFSAALLTLGVDPFITLIGSSIMALAVSSISEKSKARTQAKAQRTSINMESINAVREAILQAERHALAQETILCQTQRKVELLQVNILAQEHSRFNLNCGIHDRDEQIVALRIRLEQQKRKPGCLDLEYDPVVEEAMHKVVRDEHVRQLMKENAALIVKMGQLEAQLLSGANCVV